MPVESFFSDASLAFITSPAAGKEGTAYSMKPTDGSGDATFTRGSNTTATRIGPDGLIEKGRENLLFHSNDFNLTWSAGVSLTSGQLGYDGTNNAWLIEKTSAFQAVAQSKSASNILTFSIYAKAGDTTWIRLRTSNSETRYFQLTGAGAVGIYNPSNVISSIQSVGNGWYRCSMTVINGLTDVKVYPAEDDNVMGDTGSAYIQSAQLEVGTLMTDYIPTQATNGYAGIFQNEPRYDYFNELSVTNPLTEPYLLLEDGSTNIVRYSEYLKGLSPTTTIVTQNTTETLSPDGTNNACKLETTANAGRVSSTNHSFTEGEVITVSCYVKNINVTQIRFYYFDITNVFAADMGEFSDEMSNDEWRRVSRTFTIPFTTTNAQIQFCRITFSGQSMYAYGFQMEKQSFASSYIPNHGLSAGAERLAEEAVLDIGYDKNNDFTFFLELSTEYKRLGASESKQYFNIGDGQQFMGRVSNYGVVEDNIRNWWRMYNVNRYLDSDSNSVAKWCFIKEGLNIKVYTQGVLQHDITQELNENQYLNLELLGGKYKKILVYNTPISEEDAISLTTI